MPWLVLAGVPSGPAWGALYERGAALVMSTDIGLDTLCDLLDDLYAGREPAGGERDTVSSSGPGAHSRSSAASSSARIGSPDQP